MLERFGLTLCCTLTAIMAGLLPASTGAAESSESPKIDEILVRYKDDAGATPTRISAAQRAVDTGARVGESLAYMRSMKDGAHVMRAGRKMTRAQAWELATRMVQQGEAEFAQPIDPEFDLRPPAKPPVKVGTGAKP